MLTISQALGLGAAAILASFARQSSTGAPPIPFDEARIFVEYNVADEDAEVVVSVDADLGLERFIVVGPHGKEVLRLQSKNTQDLGIRKIDLETPEPSLQAVLDAYPPGEYKFYGRSTDGQHLFSVVTLSHELPAAPHISFPLDGGVGVPTSGAAATWTAGPDAASFFLELDQDDLGVDLKTNLPGGMSLFGFPEAWLAPGTEYQLGIAARADNGNLTVKEINFTTAP